MCGYGQDKRRFGDWAVPSDGDDDPDGRPGPGQQSDGMGVTGYKQLFLSEESISMQATGQGEWVDPDPYRRHLADLAMSAARKKPLAPGRWNPADVREVREGMSDPLREEIISRRVDPRAAGTEHAQEQGARTVVELVAESVAGASRIVSE